MTCATHKYFIKLIYGFVCISLFGCAQRDDPVQGAFQLEENTPNQFLTFLNTQPPLAMGNYALLILPNASSSGTYSGELIVQDETFDINGSWSDTVDIDWQNHDLSSDDLITTDPNAQEFTLDDSGGFNLSLSCSTECTAFILKNGFYFYHHTSQNNIISWNMADSQINSEEYAEAYYDAVDPNQTRTTLSDWQTVNGFDQGHDYHVIFRDSKDLGYGRDMYAKFHDDGRMSFYVNNFVVQLGPGNPANYGPLNLLAAVDQNFDLVLGSNAIELSPIDENDPNSDKILKFFTYTKPDENGVQTRLTSANLDGRGIKHMPGMCQVCHGATLLPLNADGSFNLLSLKSAKMNQLEMDSFEFMESGEYSLEQQEPALRAINQAVHDSFSELATRDETEQGFWDSSFAQVVAQGRYGGADFVSPIFVEDSIPTGWQQNENRPEGVEILYKQVIEPHCISCHSLRGFDAGNDEDLDEARINGVITNTGTAVNFSTYEKFIGYSDIIIDYVYRRGAMPLSLRNYEQFWATDNDAPQLLASYLPSFNVLNENNEIEAPGRPVPKIGRDRSSASPVTLHGAGSYFADQYQWSVLSQPADSTASISNSDRPIAKLITDTDGEYVIQLSVSNTKAKNIATSVTISVDSGLTHGKALTFDTHIAPLIQTTLFNQRTCQSCHYSESDIEGIPVYWDSGNDNVYRDVKARIDFNEPDNSIFIRKPTRLQHGGGIRIDLTTAQGKQVYSTIMDWIIHGAPCGTDENICGLP